MNSGCLILPQCGGLDIIQTLSSFIFLYSFVSFIINLCQKLSSVLIWYGRSWLYQRWHFVCHQWMFQWLDPSYPDRLPKVIKYFQPIAFRLAGMWMTRDWTLLYVYVCLPHHYSQGKLNTHRHAWSKNIGLGVTQHIQMEFLRSIRKSFRKGQR